MVAAISLSELYFLLFIFSIPVGIIFVIIAVVKRGK
tara:strand:+ start:1332 stop:1439 length:108 start_codon:yes stop_codon:yes gene_type:complete